MLMQTPSPDAPAVRMTAATVKGWRAVRRSCAARRRDVLRWRWRPQSAVSYRRSTPQDGDGSRRRTQTFDQCSSGFDLQQRPPWEEVAVFSLVTKGMWAKFEGPAAVGLSASAGLEGTRHRRGEVARWWCLTLCVGKCFKRSKVL